MKNKQELWVKERNQIKEELQSELDWIQSKDFSDWRDSLFITLT